MNQPHSLNILISLIKVYIGKKQLPDEPFHLSFSFCGINYRSPFHIYNSVIILHALVSLLLINGRDLCGDEPSGQAERTNEAAEKFARACISVAKELSIPVIDTWSKLQEIPNWRKSTLRYLIIFYSLN
jgi:hypothetical protein